MKNCCHTFLHITQVEIPLKYHTLSQYSDLNNLQHLSQCSNNVSYCDMHIPIYCLQHVVHQSLVIVTL